jgi:hypothetical protein
MPGLASIKFAVLYLAVSPPGLFAVVVVQCRFQKPDGSRIRMSFLLSLLPKPLQILWIIHVLEHLPNKARQAGLF